VERAAVQRVYPVLPARDVGTAVRFYVDKLGFELRSQDKEENPGYAIVRRDGVVLHLQFQFERDFQAGTAGQCMLRLAVDDPDALFEEFRDKNVFHAGTEVADKEWGTREFAFWDLNRNGLTFFRDR